MFAKFCLQINERKFGINLTNFISTMVKVKINCADQNFNCIIGIILQIIYFIKLSRDEVHTISSMIIIDNFFAKN